MCLWKTIAKTYFFSRGNPSMGDYTGPRNNFFKIFTKFYEFQCYLVSSNNILPIGGTPGPKTNNMLSFNSFLTTQIIFILKMSLDRALLNLKLCLNLRFSRRNNITLDITLLLWVLISFFILRREFLTCSLIPCIILTRINIFDKLF